MSKSPKVIEYRRKHPKCKYCKYIQFADPGYELFSYCEAKDKSVISVHLPRPFCKCYEIEDRY